MAAGKLHFKSDAGGITSVSREAGATNGELVLPVSGTVASVSGAVTDNAIARYDSTTGKLQNSAITIDDSGNIGSGTQSFNGFGGSGFKNYIINGNFDVWQYGTSQTTFGYGSDDMWNNGNNGCTKTHSRVACTDTERALFNAGYFSRTVATYVSGTNSFVKKIQSLEDITRLAGKTVTISFWAKADSNKKMNIQVVDFYGSGGTPTVHGTYAVNLGNIDLTSTWTKYKLTAALPSLVGKTLGTDGVHTSYFRLDFGFTFSPDRNEVISYGMPVGQSGTFDIAQVQLEEGSVATQFEQRPYGLELSLCQRYYETGYFHGISYNSSSTVLQRTQVFYKCNKRISPSVTISKISGVATISMAYGNASQFVGGINSTAEGQDWYGTYTASAEL